MKSQALLERSKFKPHIGTIPKKGLTLTNRTSQPMRYIFSKPIYTQNKAIRFVSTTKIISGSDCTFRLLDRKLKTHHKITANHTYIFSDTRKIYILALVVPANSVVNVKNVEINIEEQKESIINSRFNSDILVIAPNYPEKVSDIDPSGLRSTMQSYKDHGVNADIAIINPSHLNITDFYSFDGINITKTGYNEIRNLLQVKKYSKIIVYSLDEPYAQLLDATDLSSTAIYIYADGQDTLYRISGAYNKPYFVNTPTIEPDLQKIYTEKDIAIQHYSHHPNTTWVFPSKITKDATENLVNTEFKNAVIIPKTIDLELFSYVERPNNMAKKICIIRDFNNINSCSVDIDIRTILELSARPSFKKFDISIYGDGDVHDTLIAPLRNFSNVHIHKYNPTKEESAEIYHQNGIGLFANREGRQSNIAAEAALTGLVAITSPNGDIFEDINRSLNLYFETEDFRKATDIIENIATQENVFSDLTKKIHESVLSNRNPQKTIDRSLELVLEKTIFEPYQYKERIKAPLLTVVIPSYNVEKFLRNSVFSLINHKLSNQIEVLIVNDGSKDATAKIARELEKLTTVNAKLPIVRLIDKANGGHGSTINAGIREAKGKYFRLLDGDDYFITDQFEKFISILENEDSDIILTDLVEDYAVSATRRYKKYYQFMNPGYQYNLEQMNFGVYGFREWGPLLPTTTCKTSLLKEANFMIDENCFYVDMEYNFIIYAKAETVTYYPLTIYNYYLGREGQSMSKESFARNVLHHEKVSLRLLKELEDRGDSISPNKREYIINKLILPLCKTQYYVATEYFNDKHNFLSFDLKLKEFPTYYYDREIAGRIIRLHRKTQGRIVFADNILKRISQQIHK